MRGETRAALFFDYHEDLRSAAVVRVVGLGGCRSVEPCLLRHRGETLRYAVALGELSALVAEPQDVFRGRERVVVVVADRHVEVFVEARVYRLGPFAAVGVVHDAGCLHAAHVGYYPRRLGLVRRGSRREHHHPCEYSYDYYDDEHFHEGEAPRPAAGGASMFHRRFLRLPMI